jgi:hypothetical protein
MSFRRAQAEYEASMSPKPIATITGSIETYLLEGIHAEKLALLEYDENNLIGASDMATKEEINIEEISETDINRGLDALIEHGEYYGN